MAVRPIVIATALLLTTSALAGPVSGTITIPAGATGKPEARGKAYLKRIENPLVPVKPVDPMPFVVITLEKEGMELPTGLQYQLELRGESFDRPLLPVVAGSEVELRNLKNSRKTPTPYVDGQPDLLLEAPLNGGANRAFKVGTEGGKLLVLKDKKSPNLTASVLVLSTPYFAMPAADGSYTIKDVPKGDYAMRVWYRDGWVKSADAKVSVGDKGLTNKIELKDLDTGAPAAPDGEQ